MNIAHRDIKPENILMVGESDIKLTDFGFANFLDSKTKFTQVLGSPLYMAPEVIKEESYDEKVDLWAVGVIAHILLTGLPPFYHADKETMKKKIMKEPPSWGNQFDLHLSPEAV